MRALVWRRLLLVILCLWLAVALLYGVALSELSATDTEEVCWIRQQVFLLERWESAEKSWWQFSSACNSEYSLVPRWWWAFAVAAPALVVVGLLSTLRGGPRRAGNVPDDREKFATRP